MLLKFIFAVSLFIKSCFIFFKPTIKSAKAKKLLYYLLIALCASLFLDVSWNILRKVFPMLKPYCNYLELSAQLLLSQATALFLVSTISQHNQIPIHQRCLSIITVSLALFFVGVSFIHIFTETPQLDSAIPWINRYPTFVLMSAIIYTLYQILCKKTVSEKLKRYIYFFIFGSLLPAMFNFQICQFFLPTKYAIVASNIFIWSLFYIDFYLIIPTIDETESSS